MRKEENEWDAAGEKDKGALIETLFESVSRKVSTGEVEEVRKGDGEAVEVEETLPVKVTVLVLLAACVALPAGGVGVLLGVVSGDDVSVREPVEVAQAVRTEEGEPSG